MLRFGNMAYMRFYGCACLRKEGAREKEGSMREVRLKSKHAGTASILPEISFKLPEWCKQKLARAQSHVTKDMKK